jgi:hypothetical protein
MVAAEFRKLADALDKEPDAECVRPVVGFFCNSKEQFITAATAMPRPFKKKDSWDGKEIDLDYNTKVVIVRVQVPKSLTCTLVKAAQPAVYECDPILSAIEEAELEAAQ